MANRENLKKEIDKLKDEIRQKYIALNYKYRDLAHLIEDAGGSYANFLKGRRGR